ncbi:hypothetical protein CEUSTIGMA_g7864.t1 [Chlamydomonas eustigma]|uniref:Uncharacterized protein n=1 Tax=Chlamydomonas eustigma TaxID=1157962 RepID=A0A250XBF9_9CHLO|nr:hypothetical protein CEUSTIGMA_g7864.t1 [Chlamydomonas eustigma]|eukprot:GAX80425.1 hypothetical protein CEUSTIGMA_g7864.t1 [Chlamydomonas eustigma]
MKRAYKFSCFFFFVLLVTTLSNAVEEATTAHAESHLERCASEGRELHVLLSSSPIALDPLQGSCGPLDNGSVRLSFNIIMVISWTLFGVLACLDVPTLTLWMIIGVFTIVMAFVQLGPMDKYHNDRSNPATHTF